MKVGLKSIIYGVLIDLNPPIHHKLIKTFYFFCSQTSLITGVLAQSKHFVFWTMQPSSRTCISTILSHFEQVDEIVNPHFLQL